MPLFLHPKYIRQIIFTLSDVEQLTGDMGYYHDYLDCTKTEVIRRKAERNYTFAEPTIIISLIVGS